MVLGEEIWMGKWMERVVPFERDVKRFALILIAQGEPILYLFRLANKKGE
jgi:hypothetical protein